MIEIILLGKPVAKGRPRFVKSTGHTFTPEKTRSYEAALKYAAIEAMKNKVPFDGPILLDVVVKMPIPQSWPKKRQEAARTGRERPTKKPDWDNFGKVVDALNMVVWVDDGQIIDGRVRKTYSDKPGMFIRVWPISTDGVFG